MISLRKYIYILIVFLTIAGCTKDKGIYPCPDPAPIPPVPTIKFVFVNRNGFRGDSVGNGIIDTVLKGVCIDSKYYNPIENASYLTSTCNNRYALSHTLSDSITHASYNVYNSSLYAFQVELFWKRNVSPYSVRSVRYSTDYWPNGDTILVAKDTVIKFVWPDDTMPGSR